MSQSIPPTSLAAATASTGQGSGSKWYELMAEAWGKALDSKATEMESTADLINGGDDRPATITQLTAQSQQMAFLAQSAHTAISSVGTALETMARKQ